MPRWTPPDWRDASAYAPVLAGGRPALAWELLRRDPAYRRFVASSHASGDSIARWGLHFRG